MDYQVLVILFLISDKEWIK